MSYSNIHVNDFGWTARLTVQQDGVPLNIAEFTPTLILVDPTGASHEKAAAFESDGADGVIAYTIAAGDITQRGNWLILARLTSDDAELTTSSVPFFVDKRDDV